ncbi:MAG: type II secretion system protein [Solirubrobacterales bacterium]
MTRFRTSAHVAHDERGFTLVELLVVMLILALLAAIAIPAFLGQADKATDARAKSAVRTAETAILSYATDNDGEFDGATVAGLEQIEPVLTGADLTVAASADEYTLEVAASTGNAFTIHRVAADRELTCVNAGHAGCPDGGDWSGAD